MQYLERILSGHLPPYVIKDNLRILTVCNFGRVRSLAMMHTFHRKGFRNAYVTGLVVCCNEFLANLE